MVKEFKEFAMKGNVVDMAVGIIIGAAFGSIVKSLVSDIIMPPVGLLLGNVDFSNLFFIIKEGATAGPYPTVADAQKAGAVSVNYGLFLNTVISFLIVAFAVFLMVKASITCGVNRRRFPLHLPQRSVLSVCLLFRSKRFVVHTAPRS